MWCLTPTTTDIAISGLCWPMQADTDTITATIVIPTGLELTTRNRTKFQSPYLEQHAVYKVKSIVRHNQSMTSINNSKKKA